MGELNREKTTFNGRGGRYDYGGVWNDAGETYYAPDLFYAWDTETKNGGNGWGDSHFRTYNSNGNGLGYSKGAAPFKVADAISLLARLG